MPDVVNLISRVLLSSVFIVYGLFKFMDVSSITNNAGTKRFMDLIAGGAPAPTWLGYLIAAIEFLGGIAILVGFKTGWIAWAFVAWLPTLAIRSGPWTVSRADSTWSTSTRTWRSSEATSCSRPRAAAATRSMAR